MTKAEIAAAVVRAQEEIQGRLNFDPNDIAIDDNETEVSETDDGLWVRAWVFVPKPE